MAEGLGTKDGHLSKTCCYILQLTKMVRILHVGISLPVLRILTRNIATFSTMLITTVHIVITTTGIGLGLSPPCGLKTADVLRNSGHM